MFLFFVEFLYSCEDIKEQNECRLNQWTRISGYLGGLTDTDLQGVLHQAEFFLENKSTGKIKLHGEQVFVKILPATVTEVSNPQSTANLFGLPLCYHYGTGGTLGFNVWREVCAHQISTDWVKTGQCPNFPLLYHHRLIPLPHHHFVPSDSDQQVVVSKKVTYWGNSDSIRTRLEQTNRAPQAVVLFLEHIPETVSDWFARQLTEGGNGLKCALTLIQSQLKEMTTFLNTQNTVHFDAHFQNILTDGKRLYWSDLGFVLSSQFTLSEEEAAFLSNHHDYDRCFVIYELVYRILHHYCVPNDPIQPTYENEIVKGIFRRYSEEKGVSLQNELSLPPEVQPILEQYFPIAVKMNTFFDERVQNPTVVLWPHDVFRGMLEHLPDHFSV